MEKSGVGNHPKSRLAFPSKWVGILFICSSGFAVQVNSVNYSGPAWSPYLVGTLIGVLVWFTFLLADKPIGASSGYVTLAADLGKWLAPKHTHRLEYFRNKPPVSWTLLFVMGIVMGSFISALTGSELTGQFLHPMWIERFGEGSGWLRGGISLLGGVCLAFGARLAGGCTSGHGISGTLQLSLASWISLLCFFAGGVASAYLLYG